MKTYQTQDEANNDLAAGRLDYVQADALALASDFLQDRSGFCLLRIRRGLPPEDVEILGEGVGGGIRKEDTALKDKLNAAITALAQAGEFEKITDKYQS